MFDSLQRQCTAMSDGPEAQSISVTGTSGIPKVNFRAGLTPKAAQVHLISAGQGPTFTGNQYATFEIEAVDGQTVKSFPTSSGVVTNFDGTNPITAELKENQSSEVNLCDALTGFRVGSRVAAVFPLKPATASAKVNSVVLIVDLKGIFLPHATGSNQPAASGVPVAVHVASGEPGLTFPSNQAAPAEFKQYTSIKGAGEVLKTGDHIKVHYKLFLWDSTHTMVEKSWGNAPFDTYVGKGNITGFSKALLGQTIGSQVVAVIPPDLAYGANPPAGSSIPANATLVFVIDILGKY